MELRNALAARFSLDLPATLTLDYPSIAALAGYIGGLAAPVPEDGLELGSTAASLGWEAQVQEYPICKLPTILLKHCQILLCSPEQTMSHAALS